MQCLISQIGSRIFLTPMSMSISHPVSPGSVLRINDIPVQLRSKLAMHASSAVKHLYDSVRSLNHDHRFVM